MPLGDAHSGFTLLFLGELLFHLGHCLGDWKEATNIQNLVY